MNDKAARQERIMADRARRHALRQAQPGASVGGHLGVILGAAIAALRDNGASDDEIRHLTEVALASARASHAVKEALQAKDGAR